MAGAGGPSWAFVAARAGLVGHPSDGFGGATLSVTIENFRAEVGAHAAPALDIAPDGNGQWPEGGLPLVTAAIERFAQHCTTVGAPFDPRVRIRYRSTIPRQVGLGGSSAIVIATLRALGSLAGVELTAQRLPALALAVETEGLGIAAGLQDRVVQTYGGLVFMDFDPAHVAEHGRGRYEPLPAELLPPLFLAWRPDAGTSSGAAHADVRTRFAQGERRIVNAMSTLARLAHEARSALLTGDRDAFAAALDAGYDVRASIYELDPHHAVMVDKARALGLSATYTGSGGAIVGIASDADALRALERELSAVGVRVEPALVGRGGSTPSAGS
ncbi:MAG: GHMP kinase [Actinomycetota bacterium]|nr:GHMP kinase [Actinomycetota bacterium]